MADYTELYEQTIDSVFHGSDFIFREEEKQHVKKLFQFYHLSRQEAVRVPYNVLIISDDFRRAEEFCRRAIMAANKSGIFQKGLFMCSFPEYAEGLFSLSAKGKRCDIVAIYGVQDSDLETDAWRNLEDQFVNDLALSETIKILCMNTSAAGKLREENDHFFYRVFPDDYHLFLSCKPDEMEGSICQELFCSLEEALPNYECTNDFRVDVCQYIQTVYPKAALREQAFVKDLVERIVRSVFTKSDGGHKIDSDCVPAYRKPDSSLVVPETEKGSVKTTWESAAEMFPVNEEDLIPVQNPPKNILILALSTLSQLRKTTYIVPNPDDPEKPKYTCTGYYQLDPIPRFLIERLKKEGETLDEIIMFCTDQTTNPDDITNKGPFETEDGILAHTTAEEYFRCSLKYDSHYNIQFLPVPLDENNPEAAIHRAVKHLRDLNEQNHRNLRLFLDTHGGFRGVQMLTEAILSLLAHDDIHLLPENVWTVLHNNKEKNSIIRQDDTAYSIFSFVSGINEFINYGRYTSLKEYLGDTKDDLMDCIQEIADGIQFCNIPKFENGLDHMTSYFSKNPSDKIRTSRIPYLRLFEQNIQNDYTDLLISERSVVSEISWCVKKGFLQQALTLIESKIPGYLNSEKIRVIQYSERIRQILNNVKMNGVNQESDETQYLFNTVLGEILKRANVQPFRKKNGDADYIQTIIELLQRLNASDYNAGKQPRAYQERRGNIFIRNREERIYFDFCLNGASLPRLLIYHYLFHELRNRLNHASNNMSLREIDKDSLETALKNYLIHLQKLKDPDISSGEYLKLSEA